MARLDGDLDYAPLWAGGSVSVVNDILPAGDIVRRLARDADATLNPDPAIVMLR